MEGVGSNCRAPMTYGVRALFFLAQYLGQTEVLKPDDSRSASHFPLRIRATHVMVCQVKQASGLIRIGRLFCQAKL